MPPKAKDPRNITFPCTIDNLTIGKASTPLSMVAQIRDIEIKPTRMSLQLEDPSIKYPYGIVEDVLVKVDNCVSGGLCGDGYHGRC